MLTFLTSLVIMFTLVYAGVTWAKRKQRRRVAATSSTIEEGSAVPAIIDSAPDCVVHIIGAKPADDSADFILKRPTRSARAS